MAKQAPATIGDELLKDILANPTDDTPRLIYADWLEDNGQAERAASIRYALWVHRANNDDPSDPVPVAHWNDDYNKLSRRFPRWAFGKSRGFIFLARAPLGDLIRHLPSLVRQHPIERVEVTDCEPWLDTDVTGLYVWWELRRDRLALNHIPGSGELPDQIFEVLWQAAPASQRRSDDRGRWVRHATCQAALDAQSAALLTLARKEGQCQPR